MIFYKAAFYDERAFVRLQPRFRIEHNCERDDYMDITQFRVIDAGRVVFETEAEPRATGTGQEFAAKQDAIEKRLRDACTAWLIEHGYPDFESLTAYWDEATPGVPGTRPDAG